MKIEVNSERWMDLKPLRGEVWRTIEDSEKFGTWMVSNYGRVKRLEFSGGRYHYPEMIFRAHKNREGGYYKVRICEKMHYVHRLVAMAFIPNRYNDTQIDHINGDKEDNRARNLRWATSLTNMNNPITRWLADASRGYNCERPKEKRTQVNLSKYNPIIRISEGIFPLSKEQGRSLEAMKRLPYFNENDMTVNSPRWMHTAPFRGEKWKVCEQFLPDCIEVSTCGRVRRYKAGCYKILKEHKEEKGYYRVKIGTKMVSVHKLVALAFIPNPDGKPMIDHINAYPGDNRVENLRWVTNRENMMNPIAILKRRFRRPTKNGKPSRGSNEFI